MEARWTWKCFGKNWLALILLSKSLVLGPCSLGKKAEDWFVEIFDKGLKMLTGLRACHQSTVQLMMKLNIWYNLSCLNSPQFGENLTNKWFILLGSLIASDEIKINCAQNIDNHWHAIHHFYWLHSGFQSCAWLWEPITTCQMCSYYWMLPEI